MADIVVSRKVFFIGAWRTPNVSDQLLQLISNKMHEKNGYSTDLSLATDGLYLNIHNINGQVTKTDKIPLEVIADFIDNMYDNTCLLAKVKDHRDQFTVFVFLCQNEKDSAAMVQEFQNLKKNLSGEGYNLDMKQSGTNWMLKNKKTDAAIQQPNGDVKLTTTTTTTTATRISNNGVPDSVSHTSVSSDVRDEINVLAQEVKDIRLMMQKSRGRHYFAKHYGYLHSPPPTQTTINRQVFKDEVFLPPDQVSNEVNVVKRHYTKREPDQGMVIVRGRQGMYKQRQSTSSHFLRSSSQSSLASTVRKRVYPSPAPLAESRYVLPQQRVETMRLISPSQGQVPVVRKSYTGRASDIVPRNIENVYKSKKVYKRVIPVGSVTSSRNEIYDYVQAHQKPMLDDNLYAEPVRSVYVNNVPQRVIKEATTHIRYEPDQRNLYNNSTFQQQRQDVSNISTLVNVSPNKILDDSRHVEVSKTHVYREAPRSEQVVVVPGDGLQTSANYSEQISSTHRNGTQSQNVIMVTQGDENRQIREREEEISTTYRNGTHNANVIVVKSEGNIVQSKPPKVNGDSNVIYIKSENHQVQAFDDNPRVMGGEVYHVKARGLEYYDSNYLQSSNDNNVVITGPKNYDVQQTSSSNVTVISGDVSEGLWGAYAKRPEEYNPSTEIEKEKAYRYAHDTQPASSSSVIVISGDNNQGLWGAYAQKPEAYNSDSEHDKETAYRYVHDEAELKGEDVQADKDLTNEQHVPEVQPEKKVHYSEELEQTIEDQIYDSDNESDVEQHIVDTIDNEHDENDAEVKNINTKIHDDENNNSGHTGEQHFEENNMADIEITSIGTQGIVTEELREKVSQASESTVLF